MRMHLLRMALVAIPVLALSACASSGGMAVAHQAQPHSAKLITDADYIAYVERKARLRGVEVVWVNPPLRTEAELAGD